jgi:hypothetical protein
MTRPGTEGEHMRRFFRAAAVAAAAGLFLAPAAGAVATATDTIRL